MPFTPDNAIVWNEIPVRDLDAAVKFYTAVFDYDLKIDDSGQNPVAMIPGTDLDTACGQLYPGTPSTSGSGTTIHLQIPDKLENAMERCAKAGGTTQPKIETLPVGRFAYALDPDGNSIGLFEPK